MNKTFSLVLAAIGAAIIAVLAQLTIPIGAVPITLQTLAVGLVATLFKKREALFAVGIYLLLGAIGLPVFAGGNGGFQSLIGPSAGYLWCYLLFALITSSFTSPKSSIFTVFIANLLGDATVFLGGILSLHFIANMPWSQALSVGVLPFILPDLFKILLISLVSLPIFRSLKNHSYYKH